MADIIVITPQPVVVLASGIKVQELRLAVDVSAYDQVDIQAGLLAVVGTGSLVIDFPTSMQNQVDDSSWGFAAAGDGVIAGAVPQFAHTDVNKWKAATLGPVAANVAMFRFIRWRVTFTGITSATIMISGLGRRKGS